jgi:RNA polymerase sigma factor (sigma-70 family)
MLFKELFDNYKSLVFNVALQYVQNKEDAEEITQDVFVKIHEKLIFFQNQSSLKTWIYRIAINQSLDFLKAQKSLKRWSFFSALSLNNENTKIEVPHFNHPGVELEQKEALEFIFKAINQLPENQKTVLILLKIEQNSQAQTAEIMDLSTKAVESLFNRAKKNLEILLAKNEGI